MRTPVLFVFLILPFSFLAATAQTVSSEPRPIVDGTGAFGKAVVAKLGVDQSGRLKKNIHPFVIGYCGWRVKTIAYFPLTKYDGMQIGLCKTILDFFDGQITETLTSIETNANSMTKPYELTDRQAKAIHEYVVIKYGIYYMQLDDGGMKADPIAKWKYNVGGNLGELAAHLTLWWRIWTNPKFESKIASYLTELDQHIKSAPKGVDPGFLAGLRKLNSLGTKTTFTSAERRQINEVLSQCLFSAVSLTSVANLNEPIPGQSSAISNPTTLPLSNSANGKTAGEYLESGKTLAAKGDHKNAVAEFDQAAKLEPSNGSIFFQRALSREKLGMFDDAIKDYNGVIFLRFSLREAYFNRGTLYLNKKDYKAAISDLNAAISLDPKFEGAIYNRGLAYFNSKSIYAALTDFNNLLKLRPQHVNALIMRSYVYCAQGLAMSAFKDQEFATQLGGKFERGCE